MKDKTSWYIQYHYSNQNHFQVIRTYVKAGIYIFHIAPPLEKKEKFRLLYNEKIR